MGNSDSKTPDAEPKSDTSVCNCTFEWNLEIQDGEYKTGQCMSSTPFKDETSEGPIWQLLLYPSGYMEHLDDYVAVFLQCLSKDYDHTSTTFSITLHSDDRPLGVRHKNAKVKRSRIMGWFAFLKRFHIGLIDGDASGKPKKVRLTCELTSCYTKKDTESPASNSSEISKDFFNDDGDLSTDFAELYESGMLSDVTLNTGGREIKAHKVILATRSPVFYSILAQEKPTVESLDMSKICFGTCEMLVKFLYTGKTEEFTVQSAMELYIAAHRYAVFALTERCIAYLKCHYDVSNAVDVLRFANSYRESELKEIMVDFISKNFKDVADTSAWKSALKIDPAMGSEVLCHITSDYQQDKKK